MKSNSMRGVLKTVMAHDFMGAEGASIAEVVHAVTCGFKPSHVVYDSPVKSKVSSIGMVQHLMMPTRGAQSILISKNVNIDNLTNIKRRY